MIMNGSDTRDHVIGEHGRVVHMPNVYFYPYSPGLNWSNLKLNLAKFATIDNICKNIGKRGFVLDAVDCKLVCTTIPIDKRLKVISGYDFTQWPGAARSPEQKEQEREADAQRKKEQESDPVDRLAKEDLAESDMWAYNFKQALVSTNKKALIEVMEKRSRESFQEGAQIGDPLNTITLSEA